jgi:putative membrane protein
MGFAGGFMWIFWILLIAVVVWLIVAFARDTGRGSRDKTPLEILEERYARGEIDEEEFEKKRRRLTGG